MGGIQKFLGLSSFKKKEKESAQDLFNDDFLNQDKNALVIFENNNDNREKSIIIGESGLNPRKKNIPLDFMQTRYVYLSANQFSCFYHSGKFFKFKVLNKEISFGKVPFEKIKIKNTSEVKDCLFRKTNNGSLYFRFIRDKDTYNLLILLYVQDNKNNIDVATVVQMDLDSFNIDEIKKGMGI